MSKKNGKLVTVEQERLIMRYYSRNCGGDRKQMLEMALCDLWRNHPEWPSTFGPCHNPDCDGTGRGSGFCTRCVVDAIGEIVGDALAASGLHRHIVDARAEGRKLRDLVSSQNDKIQS